MKKQIICTTIVGLIMIFFMALTSIAKEAPSAKWWTKFGEPQYGGKITLATGRYAPNFDVTNFVGGEWEFWYESLFEPDWALDRNKWSFGGSFTPDQYWDSNLAESWEMIDPTTVKVHLRQGVRWQDKPPVNGREFTAYDVQEHYDRLMGTGSGYSKPNPMFAGTLSNWQKVTADDKYTVVFKFKKPCPGVAFQSISSRVVYGIIEPPEVVKEQGGAIKDWKKVVGTGPWMLKDFTANSSVTYGRNPTYWGTDPRHPDNRVPYADELVLLIIPDITTQLAALRTGKIDIMSNLDWRLTKSLKDKNPDLQTSRLSAGAWGVTFRLDKEPFNNIKVRKALQLSIDREGISKGYYGGSGTGVPSGVISPSFKGYAYPYTDWPPELKEEYAYDPGKAKKLLGDAGYPDGFSTNVIAPSIIDIRLFEAIKSQFKDIGVDMTINTMDFPSYEMYFRSGKHDQMISFIGALYTQEPSRVIDQFYSKGSDRAMTHVNDENYDAIRDRFWAASNPEENARAMMDADKHIIEQHWLVLAPESYTNTFWQPYLKGYSGELLLWGAGITYSRLWVDNPQ